MRKSKASRVRLNKLVSETIKKEGCVICGAPFIESDTESIQFHHVHGNVKHKEGGGRKYLNSMSGWTQALEISKCVTVCDGCHLRLHKGYATIPKNAKRHTAEEVYEIRYRLGQQSERGITFEKFLARRDTMIAQQKAKI